MDDPTKLGPYWAQRGPVGRYRLPVPEYWDHAPLRVAMRPSQGACREILANSLSEEAVDRLSCERPTPALYPHHVAHDFSAGAWRAANFLDQELRQQLRDYTRKRVIGALFPQNYRLRRDAITGGTYLGCTFVWVRRDQPNGDGTADIDYWQGLTLYGLYTHAKYAGDWDTMRRHWPLIRSLASYWEATSSWLFMGPGGREAGALYHGDMPTAGYAGLLGFHGLASVLGTRYQRDLAAYLLAKNAVPIAAKFGFGEWAKGMLYQELYYSKMPCTGFGELYAASFPVMRPDIKDNSGGSIWWQSRCVGPQSSQREILARIRRLSLVPT